MKTIADALNKFKGDPPPRLYFFDEDESEAFSLAADADLVEIDEDGDGDAYATVTDRGHALLADIEVVTTLSPARVLDVISNALDSPAIAYWAEIHDVAMPATFNLDAIPWLDDDDRKLYARCRTWAFAPLLVGGSIVFREKDYDGPGEAPLLILDLPAVRLGLAILLKDFPRRFAEIASEDDDAGTADTFVQCCLFGKLVYG